MRSRTSKTRQLNQGWRWVVVVCAALALPAWFTVPLSLGIASYILGVMMLVASVRFLGRSYILWDALPSILVVTVIAILSQAWHYTKERDDELQKEEQNLPTLHISLANTSAQPVTVSFGASQQYRNQIQHPSSTPISGISSKSVNGSERCGHPEV